MCLETGLENCWRHRPKDVSCLKVGENQMTVGCTTTKGQDLKGFLDCLLRAVPHHENSGCLIELGLTRDTPEQILTKTTYVCLHGIQEAWQSLLKEYPV